MTYIRELIVKRLEESPATRREIAEDTNSSRETVRHILNSMRRWGDVEYTLMGNGTRKWFLLKSNEGIESFQKV